jgi:DNA-binding transcriptional MerR regulator
VKSKTRVALKVGELAQRAGVSVRALHHYDEIGLLRPNHTSSGHRIYDADDVTRLLQIKALRQLGFSLEDIAQMLGEKDFSVREALALRLTRLREEVALRQRLLRQLETVLRHIDADLTLSIEAIFETMEAMMNVESYFTPEQLEELQARRAALGEEGLAKAQADWAALLDEIIKERDNGTEPASPRVQALAARWRAFGNAFTGGNPKIVEALRKMVHTESSLPGVDVATVRAAGAYIYQAMALERAP